ncbi:poly(3-hydroxyalkanoate) depolymerase [Porticoccus sp.]
MSTSEMMVIESELDSPHIARGLEIYWLTVMGMNIRVGIRRGSNRGKPLLLLNGIGASLEVLETFINAMGDTEVIIFDMPGAGKSDTPILPWLMRQYARLTSKVLDQLGYDIVDVLGLSWGGALAQQFARQYPQRCRRLVLCATGSGSSMFPGRPRTLLKMMSPRRYLDKKYMSRIAGDLYGGRMRKDASLVEQHASKVQAPSNRGYYYQVLALATWSSLHWLHKIVSPTLIIHGLDDPIIPPVNARIMASRIPDAELWLMDCGHLFMLTMADVIAPEIMSFLR